MARSDVEEGSQSEAPPVRVRARPDPFLVVCRCLGAVTALTALLCVFANVVSAIRCFKNGTDIFGGIFRCYAVAIALFVAVAETEWSFIIKFWKWLRLLFEANLMAKKVKEDELFLQVLEYWVGRGMLQIFVAVMTRAFSDTSGEKEVIILIQQIASYLLLACGAVYVISGLLCIGLLKRARQRKETTVEQAAKDLEELERRREELQAFLIVERG